MKESILFWPVHLKDDCLEILDETKIPQAVHYLRAKDYQDAIDAVVGMKTRAFGQFLTVCYTFVLELKKSRLETKEEELALLQKVAKVFNQSRPTFPFEEVTSMMLGFAQQCYGKGDFKSEFIKTVLGFLEGGIRQSRYRRAQEAASLLKDGDTVLTHCHVSGEMSLIGEFCRQAGKNIKFFATETRPYFQGARLSAWELKQEGFDVTLIPDNAVAKVMADKFVDCVIVGSDRSAKNGDFANKIGTYQIALLAKHFKIPFYVLAQPSRKLKTGKNIPIEIRKDDEILVFGRDRLAPLGVQAYYPGFDVTPHHLVTKHIKIEQ